MDPSRPLIELTTTIVAAYVAHNPVSAADLPSLIAQVHAALTRLGDGHVHHAEDGTRTSVKSISKSITPEYLVCLEDNRKFKSLKRHLRTHHNLTPEQYRTKYNLPPDYPMVASNYARSRSELAKKMGLGTKR